MIENIYISNKIDVFKRVLSITTRKGKSICEFTQHGFIYVHEYLCYDICFFCKYVFAYEAASKYALATADTYVNSQNLSSYIKISII